MLKVKKNNCLNLNKFEMIIVYFKIVNLKKSLVFFSKKTFYLQILTKILFLIYIFFLLSNILIYFL